MPHPTITEGGDFNYVYPADTVPYRSNREYGNLNFEALVVPMMRLDTTNRRDWQGFTRILEIMTLLDKIDVQSEHEIRAAIDEFCELPPNPGQTMSMEEVVFWAGVATGMEYERRAGEEEGVDPSSAEKLLVYSSIFAHSMKNAIVDLALGELETGGEPKRRLDEYVNR